MTSKTLLLMFQCIRRLESVEMSVTFFDLSETKGWLATEC